VVGATMVPVVTVVVGPVVAVFVFTAMVVPVVIVTIAKTKVNVLLFQDDTEKERLIFDILFMPYSKLGDVRYCEEVQHLRLFLFYICQVSLYVKLLLIK